MIVSINQKVSIESKYLDSNVGYYILKKIKNNMENKCTIEHGYITKVIRILKIISNLITPANSLVIYDVIYEAETIKPVKGLRLTGKICMVFEHGVFIDIINRMKVLIPTSKLKGYKYSSSSFTDEYGNVLKVNTEVDIIIDMIKYEKKEYSCIGELIKVNT